MTHNILLCAHSHAHALNTPQIKPVMRFMSDTSLSGGSWLWACPTPTDTPTHTQRSAAAAAAADTGPHAGVAAAPLSAAALQDLDHQTVGPDSGSVGGPGGGGSNSGPGSVLFEVVERGSSSRRSGCDVEVVCSWRCLHSLTPDATQLAQHDWQPQVNMGEWEAGVMRGGRQGGSLSECGCQSERPWTGARV